MKDHAPCIERHRQALSRTLRVPHDTNAPVAGQRCAECLFQSHVNSVELMVARQFFDQHSPPHIFEDDEVAD